MTEKNWTKQGETFSHKNACKEFDLTEDQILSAMKSGDLDYKQNSTHGNPYYRLLRSEVQKLAKSIHGVSGLKYNKIKHDLKLVDKEINSLKRKLVKLEKEKVKLLESLSRT